ncbi:ABC transporter permease, partial [Rhizobiaceae sp. 2RAB30]
MASRILAGNTGPVLIVVAALVVIWYGFAVYLNAPWQLDLYQKDGTQWTMADLVRDTLHQDRPVLPSPLQVVEELWKTTVQTAPTSKRSLVYHGWVTLSSTLLGFAMGTVLGIVLAVFIVHNRAMDRSVMPWIIASQTIPILAIAPLLTIWLGFGLAPKVAIAAIAWFFPAA